MQINHDLHVHTYLSACCADKERQTPANVLMQAEKMGLRTLGFADHLWVNPDLAPSNWYRPQDASQIDRLREDLAGLSKPVRVLVGCEAETVAPGKFGITPEFAATVDFVLLSCSHFHMKSFVAQPQSGTPRALADHLLAFFRSAVESGLATAIPHPLRPLGHIHNWDAAIASIGDAEFLDAFGPAAERGVGIEITTGFLEPTPEEAKRVGGHWSLDTPLRFLSLARQAGCKFIFATDAHDPDKMKRLPELQQIVEPLDLTEEDILPLARGGTSVDPP